MKYVSKMYIEGLTFDINIKHRLLMVVNGWLLMVINGCLSIVVFLFYKTIIIS